MISNGVSKFGLNQDRDSFSVWRVIIPAGVDREQYIKKCYLTNSITIINDNGEIVDNVKCGRLTMQLIDFPLDVTSTGSEILCATLPYSGEIRVIDVYATEIQYGAQQEDQFYFHKRHEDGSAGALIDGKGNLILTVAAGSNKGTIVINVTDNNKTGELIINTNGRTLIRSNRIDLNEDGQAMLLGDTTVELISELLDQLTKESAGPFPLLGNSKYAQLKQQFIDKLKSTLSFVK